MDIGITWDNATGRGDWSVALGDLALAPDLLSAIMVSLFTDRVAPVQPTAADAAAGIGVFGTGAAGSALVDRRGWWGDAYVGRPIGSRLWQLRRAVKAGQTALLREAESICSEALQWLLDDGVVATAVPACSWLSATAILIAITVTEPASNTPQTFRFQYAWAGL